MVSRNSSPKTLKGKRDKSIHVLGHLEPGEQRVFRMNEFFFFLRGDGVFLSFQESFR